MNSVLPPLQAAPDLQARRELVPCPELQGSVWVHGLMASETFAIVYLRRQALRRVHEAADQYRAAMAAMPPDRPRPEFVAPALELTEASAYGRYSAQLLALAVRLDNGLCLFTEAQWELAPQHYPGLIERLQPVAERLSGLNKEEVEKNSTATPS